MEPSLVDSDVNSLALQTRGVHKFYGRGSSAFHVLRGLDMDVPYGTIYGLLGASGCGKTTLLRCVLGRLPIRSGRILILGQPPGAPGHTVPGKDVGYMPQETALIFEFTMLELMYYFGILYRMNLRYTRQRTEFLKDFLNLPTMNKRCGLLSGGQKRRVSFALALLHEPPLLILDEPTVGIDPLLRAKIWRHLLEITSSGNTTIIITTHYIEEARQAHVVGLMRAGTLLAQSKPDDLIRAFNVTTLEDVFLKLSEEQELQGDQTRHASKSGASIKYPGSSKPSDSETTPLIQGTPAVVKAKSFFSLPHLTIPRFPKPFNMAALFWKQMLKFFREPVMLFFLVISPLLQMSIFCLAYGTDLKDLKIYYTNFDTTYYSDRYDANFTLGRRFLSHIDDDAIDLEEIGNPDAGVGKVRDGVAWGYFSIPADYSFYFFEKMNHTCSKILDKNFTLNNTILDGATIQLHMDVTNQQIYYTVNQKLNEAAQIMQNEVLNMTDIPARVFQPLVVVRDYIYGGPGITFFDTLATSLFGGVTIALSMTLTATQLITERKEGVIDRTWVAGVNVVEIVLTQTFAFFFMILAQIIPQFFFIVYVFDLPREGNLAIALFLIMMEGMVGVTFGLMVSALLDSEATALELSVGIFYPIIIVGGIMWPIESMPKWIQVISRCMPVAIPCEAIRSVFLRGWGFDDEVVWLGFLITVAWIVFFVVVAGLGLQVKK